MEAPLLLPADVDVVLSMPSGVPMVGAALASAGPVRLDSGTKVMGTVSGAGGDVEAGSGSRITGAVTAIGDVHLRIGARVEGTARATSLVRVDKGARASDVLSQQTIPLTAPRWTVHREAGLPAVVIVLGAKRDLPPGTYDEIIVGPGATLRLSAGVYFARKAVFFRGSRLDVDSRDGLVQLYVEDELHFRPKVTASEGRPELLVAYLGTEETRLAPGFAGAFVAPNARVMLGSCRADHDDRCEARHRDALHRPKDPRAHPRTRTLPGHGPETRGRDDEPRGKGRDHDAKRDDGDRDGANKRERDDQNGRGGEKDHDDDVVDWVRENHDGARGGRSDHDRDPSDRDRPTDREWRDHQTSCSKAYDGVFYGASIEVESGAEVRNRSFDWLSVVEGTSLENVNLFVPSPDFAAMPKYNLPRTPFDDDFIADAPLDAVGREGGITTRLDSLVGALSFTMPFEYGTAGGIIANGSVDLRFRSANGANVTCTYRGLSGTSAPVTPNDLNLGRRLRFERCSDGSTWSAQRTGTNFEVTVRPVAGYPVTVKPPVSVVHGCTDELELLSPTQTSTMRASFPGWTNVRRVEDRDAAGRPTLFYAWVFLRTEKEAIALRQLSIHRLDRPLLTAELDAFAGKCGVFTNSGDGYGAYVPAIIPGTTYNALIDAADPRVSPDIVGDRVVFESVLLRDVPESIRGVDGSVRLESLAASGFRYLDYESVPTADRIGISRASSNVTRIYTDILTFIFQKIETVVDAVTMVLSELSQLFDGSVRKVLYMHTTTQDPAFISPAVPDPVVIRGWGNLANRPLAAPNMRVKIIQKVLEVLPASSRGKTNSDGRVEIEAARRSSNRGSGLCITLQTSAALMSSFLTPTGLCDFRGLIAGSPTSGDFKLNNFDVDETLQVIVDHDQLSGLYQSDDVYQWARKVAKFKPAHRSRILTGFLPTTFSTTNSRGQKRPSTPCFGYVDALAPGFTVIVATAAGPSGILAAAGYAANPLGGIALSIFTNILMSSDEIYPSGSSARVRRELMAHEYGHFLFCSLLYNNRGTAVDHIAKAWAANNFERDFSQPFQYINEGFADFIAGQVAGAATYQWRNNVPGPAQPGFQNRLSGACLAPNCFEANINQNSLDIDSNQLAVGRTATLLMDAFDGHGGRFALVPGNGDMWQGPPPATLSQLDYDPSDSRFERVALGGDTLKYFGDSLNGLMGPIDIGPRDTALNDASFFQALNLAMQSGGNSWCDRCRVLPFTRRLGPRTSPSRAYGKHVRWTRWSARPSAQRRRRAAEWRPTPATRARRTTIRTLTVIAYSVPIRWWATSVSRAQRTRQSTRLVFGATSA